MQGLSKEVEGVREIKLETSEKKVKARSEGG